MIDIKELLKNGEEIFVEFKESKRELNKDVFELELPMSAGAAVSHQDTP